MKVNKVEAVKRIVEEVVEPEKFVIELDEDEARMLHAYVGKIHTGSLLSPLYSNLSLALRDDFKTNDYAVTTTHPGSFERVNLRSVSIDKA